MVVELDKKDKQILRELDLNARITISSIAKRVKLSKEVVNYRLKNLIKKKVIDGTYAILDITKLGYMYFRIFIKFSSISQQKEDEIIEYGKSHPNIGWIISYEGKWDIVLVIWARSLAEFEKSYDDLTFQFGKYFQQQDVSIAFKIYHFKNNYLYDLPDSKQLVLGGSEDIVGVDKIDLKILGLLTKNARMPILDIGKNVGITANAVKYRIRKLEEKQVILGYGIKLNYSILGYEHYKVFIYLQNMSKLKQNQLITYLKDNPNIIYITKATGVSDLEFEAIFQNQNKLHEMIREIRGRFAENFKDHVSVLCYSEPLINYLPTIG